MPRLHHTAYMPAGTTITTEDGTITKQTSGPHGDPFPWHTDDGSQYGNEWAAEQISKGATVIEPGEE